MRTKLVKRYWCDFCNKAGLSAGAMAKHEKHCTLNPNRECRVCKMVSDAREADFVQKPLSELVALLPVPIIVPGEFGGTDFQYGFDDLVSVAIPVLRKAAGDCPACMMAALRQAKIPVPIAKGFNFTEEMKSIWADINQAQMEREYA